MVGSGTNADVVLNNFTDWELKELDKFGLIFFEYRL